VSHQTLDSWDVVYEERFSKVQKHKTSARFPGWNCMFLPPSTFRLPTAKLYDFDGAVYLCVAYDKILKLYKFDEPTLQMKPVKIENAFFRSMFADTFCADDIYWNYAIIMNADYLGLEPELGELNVGTSSSSKDLYKTWKSIADTLIP